MEHQGSAAPLTLLYIRVIISTGFSTGGATFDDVKLFAENVAPHVKIKAAGGISSLADAEKFIELGADRLGTSKVVKIAKGLEAGEGY